MREWKFIWFRQWKTSFSYKSLLHHFLFISCTSEIEVCMPFPTTQEFTFDESLWLDWCTGTPCLVVWWWWSVLSLFMNNIMIAFNSHIPFAVPVANTEYCILLGNVPLMYLTWVPLTLAWCPILSTLWIQQPNIYQSNI